MLPCNTNQWRPSVVLMKIEFNNFCPDGWCACLICDENDVHEAVEVVADGCVDVNDATHFSKVVQVYGFDTCSGACFFNLLLLNDFDSAFHSCLVFCCSRLSWRQVVKCKMCFDPFWVEDRVLLMCPSCCPDCCCAGLVKQFCFQSLADTKRFSLMFISDTTASMAVWRSLAALLFLFALRTWMNTLSRTAFLNVFVDATLSFVVSTMLA